MRVLEIAPGLWRWTGLHPDWTPAEGGPEGWEQEVGCLYYEAPDAVVLIDPLVPPEEPDRFWDALDRDVERAGLPVEVLLTIFWHARSAQAILDRYDGARVWAHAPAAELVRERTTVTDTFEAGAPLPGGVETFSAHRAYEVVFWLPEHRALAVGDVLLGAKNGGVRLCPDSWLGSLDRQKFRAGIRSLLDLPVERILVAHGEPVLEGGHAALVQALA